MPVHHRPLGAPELHGLSLQADDVHQVYVRGLAALDGVTMSVGAGEWVSLVGPSGAGKSTLLHLFAGLDVPTAGRILVAGRDLAQGPHLAPFRRLEVGIVFQLHNLLPHLDARRNVEIVMFGTGLSGRERRRRAGELLERLDLAAQAPRKPPQLSGGERQRVAIARALANEPRLLLADEPTGSLDPANVRLVSDLLSELHRAGTTIVLVTHDDELARRSDRVVELRGGRVARVSIASTAVAS